MFLSQAAIDAVFGSGAGHEPPPHRPGPNSASAAHAHTRAEAFRAAPTSPAELPGTATPARSTPDAPAR